MTGAGMGDTYQQYKGIVNPYDQQQYEPGAMGYGSNWQSQYMTPSKPDRYNEILGGYNDRYNRNVGALDAQAAQTQTAIGKQFAQVGAQQQQGLVSRGLANTSVVDTMNQGLASKQADAQASAAANAAAQKATLDANLSGDTLSFQERYAPYGGAYSASGSGGGSGTGGGGVGPYGYEGAYNPATGLVTSSFKPGGWGYSLGAGKGFDPKTQNADGSARIDVSGSGNAQDIERQRFAGMPLEQQRQQDARLMAQAQAMRARKQG